MKFPHGPGAVREVYGDPRPYTRPDGTIRPEWERHTLAICELPAPLPLSWDAETKVSRIRCHHLLVEPFGEVFNAIHDEGLWPELREFGGCYAWRPQRGGTNLSLHSWGAAVDLNPSTNPLGELGDMPLPIVQMFEAHGFTWGGRFARLDSMHLQAASGY